MEKWSRGYAALKVLVKYAFWLSHKRIVVVGRERIPKNIPLIFAPNHQNALMDALAVLLTNRTQPVWLARADIFKSGWARKVLTFLKIVPVYRIRDGKENLDRNDETFSLSVRVLENKQALALFPEAAHTGRRQMISHKKAVPRIAFLSEEKHQFKLGTQIIPVGIYYSHYWDFNRSVIVQYGDPILVADYKTIFEENEQTAVRAMREEIYRRIKSLVLHIESQEYYSVYEQIRDVAGETLAKRANLSKNRLLNRSYSDKKLVEALEMFEQTEPDAFAGLADDVKTLTHGASRVGVRLEAIGIFRFRRMLKMSVQLIFAVACLPVFAAGLLFNGLPFLIPRALVRRKLKDPIFRSTFNLVLGLVLFPVFYLMVAAILGFVLHSFLLAFLLFWTMPLLGKLAYEILEFYGRFWARMKFLWMLVFSGKQARELIRQKLLLTDKLTDILNYQSEEIINPD